MLIEKIIFEFKNNVLCRNESNQHKANLLWNKILKHYDVNNLDNKSNKIHLIDLAIEWDHYMLNELGTNEFGNILNNTFNKINE